MNITTYPCRSALSKIAIAMTTISISSVAMAQTIQSVSVNQANAQTTELYIDFAGNPVEPIAYQQDNPNRLVLDFNGASNTVNKLQRFNQGSVKDVSTVSSGNTTRMVIGLNDSANFSTRVQGNRLVVSMTSGISANNIAPTPGSVGTVTGGNHVTAPLNTMNVRVNPLLSPNNITSRQANYDGLSSLNFSPSGNGGGNVTINVNNENIPLDVQRSGDELIVRMTGATIPNHLLSNTAGNGLVRNIVTNNQGRNGVIRIAMQGDYEYKAYQSGSQLNISIEPPKKLREPTLEERTYSGAPISMDFQNMDVRQILFVLGEHTNTNIVASDSVTGTATLRLINVPWDQALDIILKSKGLDKRTNGNVIWVAPAKELAKQEADELISIKEKEELDPVRTEYIRLNYAKAEDLRTMIESRRGNSNDRNTSLLSSRGTVTIDARTNTLIVQDTSHSLANIRDLIKQLDIPVKQVMIEARIVSATDTFSKELGVSWGVLSNGIGSNRHLLVGGSQQTLWDLKTPSWSGTTPTYTISRPDNLSVNLGVANPTGRIAFGLLSISDMLLDLELTAMQADNKGEIISSPKVLTTDKQKAKIMSGTQIAYQEAAASGATSTSWVEAALSLEVTPNITPEGRIGMDLNIENGRPIQAVDGSVAIEKDSIQTNVIVDDGQTVVLGGVFKNTSGNTVNKVPFLGDLPYVNRLFKKTVKVDNKSELLIFITPKLVNDRR